MKADYHLHTNYSLDSETPMEDMVKRAIEIGLDEIVFTEHVEHSENPSALIDYGSFFKELEALKEKYKDQISIKRGVEFGVQPHRVEVFNHDFHKYNFDFVILSKHAIDDKEVAFQRYQKDKTQEEYQQGYYQATLDSIKAYKNFSVLGHLDFIKRYDLAGEYPDEKVLPTVEKIFKQLIADGKGIEVNTSSFKYGLKDLCPSRRFLELYHELGGTIITIGSDSHDTKYIGDHIDDVKEILKEIGFKSFCTFDKMKPIFHDL